MSFRLPLLIAAPAVPLFVAAVQPLLFPAMTSHIGWYVTAASVAILTAIVLKTRRDGTFAPLPGGWTPRRLMMTLLIASATVPLATEILINLGLRADLFHHATANYLHVLMVTVILMLVTIEVSTSMQRLEMQRAQSESRLRLQIDRIPIAYITCSRDFEVSSWSPAAERLFGWSEVEIVGQSAGILVPGGMMKPDLKAVWQRLLEGDFAAHSINENITKDGRIILCRWSNTPLTDSDGHVTAVISMAENITEEQRTQNALRQTQERYRELVDSLPHYVFSVTNEDRYVAVNQATCEFFGRPESEIIGRTPSELGVPPDIARGWLEQKAKTRASGSMQTTDSVVVIGGLPRQHRTITSPMRDENGTIFGVTGISMDITDQMTAEAAKQDLLHAVEQLDEVMFTTDRDGIITYVNNAFERVYGYTRDEALGKTPRILKSGENSPEQYRQLWAELLDGRSIRSEYRNRRKDGSLVDVIGSASPLVDNGGEITGFVAVQRDISQEKRAAEERRELDSRLLRLAKMEALGTLAGGMAHDFNNILSIILTHATLLERKPDAARLASTVATVKQAVQRGASITRQILTFARRADTKAAPLNTANLIMEVASMVSETFPRTIHVTLNLDPDLPLISADAGQLHQALLNLCVNARDAMPNGGDLRLDSRLIPAALMKRQFTDAGRTDYLCISIADNGFGMDDETRRRIFEPFFTTKPQGQGTGLGLAMVHGVVNSHGGLIDIESQVGRGTTFRLYFPIVTPAAAPVRERRKIANSINQETLLVVDDEISILDGLAEGLRVRGYRVFTASDGAQAIQTLESIDRLPDALVMDLGMPKMSAEDLVKALRAIAPDLPLIGMTGYIDPKVHAQVIRAGVKQTLQKPFEVDELVRCLREVLEEPALTSAP